MEFAYDGGGLAKGGTATLYVDGKKCGEGRVERTERLVFSADETCDVGFGAGSPVTYEYGTHDNEFSGEVNWVEIDIGKDAIDLDHLITAEDRLRVAMARQSNPHLHCQHTPLGRHYRHEGFAVSGHAPHSNEQLSHCRDDCHFAGFACRPQPFGRCRSQALRRIICSTTIQGDLRKRAFPNGIAGPFVKRFLPDCRMRGMTPI